MCLDFFCMQGPQIALGRSARLFPLALLAALRGGRARVHEKEEVK